MPLQLVEVARQKGDLWLERILCKPEDVQAFKDKYPEEAIYQSTFILDVDESNVNVDTSKLFEVSPKSGDLFFDFDSNDLEKAKEDCISVYEHLTKHLDVPRSKIKIYFSGHKGYHLIIPWSILGLSPDPELHLNYLGLATSISGTYTRNQTLDLKIYNARRLFRLPQTVHQTTGKKKEEVNEDFYPYSEGDFDPGENEIGQEAICYLLNAEIAKFKTFKAENYTSTGKLPAEFLHVPLDCIQYALDYGAPEGKRNDYAYTTILYFKACGLSQEEIYQKLISSALCQKSGLSEKEIKSSASSAFRSDKSFGLRHSVLAEHISEKDRERWQRSRIEEDYESLEDVARQYVHELKNPNRQVARYFIPSLDDRIGTINGGELVLVGGSTGTGKSEFVFHIAYTNAQKNTPTAFISLELDNKHFVARYVRSCTEIPAERFYTGSLHAKERDLAIEAANSLIYCKVPLFFRRKKSMMNVEELEKLVENLILEQGCRLVIIDHLHYIAGKQRYDNESQNVASAIRSINSIAIKYNVGIIVVAHFRKQYDPFHRPTMHEFRDSSAIEQEAHTVLLLWRNMQGWGEEQFITEIILGKTRKEIPLGTIVTKFDPATRQYVHYEK